MVDDVASLSSASSMASFANHLGGASLGTPNMGAPSHEPAALTPRRQMRGARGFKASAARPVARPIFGGVAPPPSKPMEDDAVRSVFLFTNGMANVGLRDAALVSATKQMLDANLQV